MDKKMKKARKKAKYDSLPPTNNKVFCALQHSWKDCGFVKEIFTLTSYVKSWRACGMLVVQALHLYCVVQRHNQCPPGS